MTITIFPGLPPTPVFLAQATACMSAAAAPDGKGAFPTSAQTSLCQPSFLSGALSLLGPQKPTEPASAASNLWWEVPSAISLTALLSLGLSRFFQAPKADFSNVTPGGEHGAYSLFLDAPPVDADAAAIKPLRGNHFEVTVSADGSVAAVDLEPSEGVSEPVVLSDGAILRQGDRFFVFRNEGGPHFEVHNPYGPWEDVDVLKPQEGSTTLKELYAAARNGGFDDSYSRPEIEVENVQLRVLEASEEEQCRVEEPLQREATQVDFDEALLAKSRTTLRSEVAQENTVKARPLPTMESLTTADLGYLTEASKTTVDIAINPAEAPRAAVPSPTVKMRLSPKILEDIVPKVVLEP